MDKNESENFYSPHILGTGSYLPEHIVPNAFLEKKLGLKPGFIAKYLGVSERRSCRDLQTMEFDFKFPEIEMAVRACKNAIQSSGIDTKDITSVLFTTELASKDSFLYCQTVQKPLPGEFFGASWKRRSLSYTYKTHFLNNMGLRDNVSFQTYPHFGSIHLSGCADFHLALYSESGVYRAKKELVLVVASSAASTYAKLYPSKDLNNIISQSLFGDGAAAMILDYRGEDNNKPLAIYASGNPSNDPVKPIRLLDRNNYPESFLIDIDHKLVLEVAPEAMLTAVREVLEWVSMDVKDIDWFLLHQASGPTHKKTMKLLKDNFGNIPARKIPTNYQQLGNTGLVSTLLLLDEKFQSGQIKEGDKVLMASAGAGLVYAGLLFNV